MTATEYTRVLPHVNVDPKHKLIRPYPVTDAAVHERRVFEQLLDEDNSSAGEALLIRFIGRRNPVGF